MLHDRLNDLLTQRFGAGSPPATSNPVLERLAARGSCRSFTTDIPDLALIETLCAVALSAPSKSDLQQRNILIVDDSTRAATLKDLLQAQEWISGAPRLLLFLADNRRQRLIQQMHDQPFPNDHLDAFFNASLDAGIALAFFMVAAEASGLGCCPISTIRNHLPQVATLFDLPDHVFPIAALAVGTPAHATPRISPRLARDATIFTDHYRETSTEDIADYDQRRSAAPVTPPGAPLWSEGKARMYAAPQREDFADFVTSIGFRLR